MVTWFLDRVSINFQFVLLSVIAGCLGEKIGHILDQSQILQTGQRPVGDVNFPIIPKVCCILLGVLGDAGIPEENIYWLKHMRTQSVCVCFIFTFTSAVHLLHHVHYSISISTEIPWGRCQIGRLAFWTPAAAHIGARSKARLSKRRANEILEHRISPMSAFHRVFSQKWVWKWNASQF